MRKASVLSKLLSVVLVLAILASWAMPAGAADHGLNFRKVDNSSVSADPFNKDPVKMQPDQPVYADSDVVRVAIVLNKKSTIEAGYAPDGIASNEAAMKYRAGLKKDQDAVITKIEKATGEKLDVVWNLTLAANLISANVEYGQIAKIQKIKGVQTVAVEEPFEPDVVSSAAADPNMATSAVQTGVAGSYASGYTGAGSRIAIIDTGLDVDHQAFDPSAYYYSLSNLAGKKGLDPDTYMAGLDLLDAEEIASVLAELNVVNMMDVAAEQLYVNGKVPFGFNYVDAPVGGGLSITHLNDTAGEHGSHVAGIAAANAYVPDGNGGFESALASTMAQGVAPDAQLLVMKVFGANGGAYAADYMAAIEDAIILGADSVNLSLGSGNPGMSSAFDEVYDDIMASLEKSGVVVCTSTGNSGSWVEASENGVPYLYLDDVSMHAGGSPGTFVNSLGVASVDNAGYIASYLTVGDEIVEYYEGLGYGNQPFYKLAGEREFVFLNGIGLPEQFQALDLEGKIAVCYRGETSFFEKANAAASQGAAGVIIVNNVPEEIIGLNLTGYEYTAPVVSLTLEQGELLKAVATAVNDADGNVWYWTGSMHVSNAELVYNDNPYYTMSSFSSWGVPGSLIMKPEITAPGGLIHSVGGAYNDGSSVVFGDHASYELMSGTSMAAPQVSGMAALVAQYVRENGLADKTGLDERTLAQSLLMSTAVPVQDGENGGYYYPVLQQGAGLANVGAAVMADSYILMGADATASWADGKVKAELGDDPQRNGVYSFSFTINNLSGQEQTYVLFADFFTQGAASDGVNLYLAPQTMALAADVAWKVNGKAVENGADLTGLDFNGDGYVNTQDGQALLDYAVGVRDSLHNDDLADLNADGKINSHDSYLFFQMLGQSGATVPANGSVTVEVTVTLSEDEKAYLDTYYENGAYLEGYVYAESLSTPEGVAGTTHSVPVLGFYGNWSDASVYDKGSYVEYAHGEETRAPYLYESNFAMGNYNGLLISYGDEPGAEYWFGGHPFGWDESYMPERNAISAANGDMISTLGIATIRNAAIANFRIWNSQTGEYYLDQTVTDGPLYSAYYYVNGGYWANTYYNLSVGYCPTDLPNNTAIEVGLTAALEYYMNADGSVDWDALGDGATFSMPMVVDNEAPVLQDLSLGLLNNTLTVEVSDNQYIAGVALFDAYGQYMYTAYGSDPAQAAGDTLAYEMDLSGINGKGFLLQVYDYALNTVTYELDIQLGEVTDVVESVTLSDAALSMQKGSVDTLTAVVMPLNASNRDVVWSSSDESIVSVDENGNIAALNAGTAVVTAASVLDPAVSASCTVTVIDVAVDLNAFIWDEEGSIWYSQFNTATLPDYQILVGDFLGVDYMAAACMGPDGIVYASSLDTSTGTGSLYAFDPATAQIMYMAPCSVQGMDIFYSDLTYVPGMFGTGCLLASYGPYVIALDPATGEELMIIDQYDNEIVGIATCYGYYDPEYNESMDTVYVVLKDGTVIQEIYAGLYDYGMIVPYIYYMYGMRSAIETGVSVGDTFFFNSAYYDPMNAMLFFTAFDYMAGDSDVQLYALDEMNDFVVHELGAFSDSVWPVAGLHQYVPAVYDEAAAAAKLEQIHNELQGKELVQRSFELKFQPIEKKAAVNNAQLPDRPLSDAVVGEGEKTVTVQITAGEMADLHTNGVSSVTYDPEALELQGIFVEGDYTAVKEEAGKVTFGYVSLEGKAADAVVATLVFAVKNTDDSKVTVEYSEVNDQTPGTVEDLPVEYPHANTEVRDEKAPTCTEEGYTGDIWCTDCGKLVAAGEVIPATGHQHTEIRDAKAPTCTEQGYTGDTWCTDCGEKVADGEAVPATGHQHTEIRDAKAPTCTEEGYTGDTWCTDCGEKVADGEAVPATGHQHTEIRDAKEATCTEHGYTGDTWCTDCGEKVADGEATPTAPHSYENGKCVHCGLDNPKAGDDALLDVAAAALVLSAMSIVALPVIRKKHK